MIVVVHDANILIDLYETDLLVPFWHRNSQAIQLILCCVKLSNRFTST